MTLRAFCQHGEGEAVKCCWHGTMGVLAFGAFAYNAVAWVSRRDRHLALNACLYGALTVLEVKKARHHMVV